MQLTCPNCGEKVTAENINIQKMTAVCSACDTVFSFDLPEAQKAKRRKTKQPANLTLSDNETLQMAFWTNFRLDQNEDFISSMIGGIGATLVALLFMGKPDSPVILTFAFLVIGLALLYRLALTVVNKTHIEMDENVIKVTRKPIPSPFNHGYELPLAGVIAIQYEETAASKKEAYDTPRYLVCAKTADGSRRTIINDVTEDYAVFIAQRLEERLQTDTEFDVSRLEDQRLDNQIDGDEIIQTSQNSAKS